MADTPSLPTTHGREALPHLFRQEFQQVPVHLFLDCGPEAELAALANKLGELWQSCSARDERRRHLLDQLRDVGNLTDALHAYEALDVDLGRLQGDFRFLDLRIGTVDIDELRQLSDAVRIALRSGQLLNQSEVGRDVRLSQATVHRYAGSCRFLQSVSG